MSKLGDCCYGPQRSASTDSSINMQVQPKVCCPSFQGRSWRIGPVGTAVIATLLAAGVGVGIYFLVQHLKSQGSSSGQAQPQPAMPQAEMSKPISMRAVKPVQPPVDAPTNPRLPSPTPRPTPTPAPTDPTPTPQPEPTPTPEPETPPAPVDEGTNGTKIGIGIGVIVLAVVTLGAILRKDACCAATCRAASRTITGSQQVQPEVVTTEAFVPSANDPLDS